MQGRDLKPLEASRGRGQANTQIETSPTSRQRAARGNAGKRKNDKYGVAINNLALIL